MNNDFITFPDKNECDENPCAINAECTDGPGFFNCTCMAGYTGDGLTLCEGTNTHTYTHKFIYTVH